ncbi:MAG: hypothetical protein UR26_C0002G0128 [candidate division TM6 bacterium GW2011_GWF2_32_72]|nr:MAG: hypothetical protein UR26_C0002G0128 [candidate division TM6 bacterium GW2011_GWF2_32_72]
MKFLNILFLICFLSVSTSKACCYFEAVRLKNGQIAEKSEILETLSVLQKIYEESPKDLMDFFKGHISGSLRKSLERSGFYCNGSLDKLVEEVLFSLWPREALSLERGQDEEWVFEYVGLQDPIEKLVRR